MVLDDHSDAAVFSGAKYFDLGWTLAKFDCVLEQVVDGRAQAVGVTHNGERCVRELDLHQPLLELHLRANALDRILNHTPEIERGHLRRHRAVLEPRQQKHPLNLGAHLGRLVQQGAQRLLRQRRNGAQRSFLQHRGIAANNG